MHILHFSILFVGGLASHADKLSPAASRKLSDETTNLLNSRLIFVYDDAGCRGMEGMQSDDDVGIPVHRSLALRELDRRLRLDFTLQMEGLASEGAEAPSALKSIYLEALEMEIAHVPDGMSLARFEEATYGLPCVKFVARNEVKFIENVAEVQSEQYSTEKLSNDPLFKYQWGLHRGNESAFGIDAETVWANWDWQGSEDMTIAIIDSGCNMSHPDMKGQFWTNFGETDCNDGIDNDGNGFVDDCHGWDFVEDDNDPQARGTSHGTAAAGIIAAKSGNREGIAGVCGNCRLMCLRFISNTEGTVANEVRAIDYAVRMGAKISNNSYGGYAKQGSMVEREAIERAYKKGHIFISSAGNNNIGTDNAEYMHTPSGYEIANVISVGASAEDGRKTSFSNFGARSVHTFAPGRNVISTGREGYLVNQGTSFAAPHVTGIAGLIWSRYPQLLPGQVISILKESCRPNIHLVGQSHCPGVINAVLAMKNAEARHRESSWTSPAATFRKQSDALLSALSSLLLNPPNHYGNTIPDVIDDRGLFEPPEVVAFAPSPLESQAEPRLKASWQLFDDDVSNVHRIPPGEIYTPGLRASMLSPAGLGTGLPIIARDMMGSWKPFWEMHHGGSGFLPTGGLVSAGPFGGPLLPLNVVAPQPSRWFGGKLPRLPSTLLSGVFVDDVLDGSFLSGFEDNSCQSAAGLFQRLQYS